MNIFDIATAVLLLVLSVAVVMRVVEGERRRAAQWDSLHPSGAAPSAEAEARVF